MCSGELGVSVNKSVRFMQLSVIVALGASPRASPMQHFCSANMVTPKGFQSFRGALSKERPILDKTARGLQVSAVKLNLITTSLM